MISRPSSIFRALCFYPFVVGKKVSEGKCSEELTNLAWSGQQLSLCSLLLNDLATSWVFQHKTEVFVLLAQWVVLT